MQLDCARKNNLSSRCRTNVLHPEASIFQSISQGVSNRRLGREDVNIGSLKFPEYCGSFGSEAAVHIEGMIDVNEGFERSSFRRHLNHTGQIPKRTTTQLDMSGHKELDVSFFCFKHFQHIPGNKDKICVHSQGFNLEEWRSPHTRDVLAKRIQSA